LQTGPVHLEREISKVLRVNGTISLQIYYRYYLKYWHHDTSLLSRSKIASIFQEQVERREARNNVELEMLALFKESINVV